MSFPAPWSTPHTSSLGTTRFQVFVPPLLGDSGHPTAVTLSTLEHCWQRHRCGVG